MSVTHCVWDRDADSTYTPIWRRFQIHGSKSKHRLLQPCAICAFWNLVQTQSVFSNTISCRRAERDTTRDMYRNKYGITQNTDLNKGLLVEDNDDVTIWPKNNA